MDHAEAERQMLSERYLLNELMPEVREEFEEHFFTCPQCALDLEAGAAFLEHSKAVLSSPLESRELTPEASAATSPSKRRRPTFRFWPVLAGISAIILLGVVGYQNWVEYPNARQVMAVAQRPKLLSAATIVNTRGGAIVTEVKSQPDTPALLSFDIPEGTEYSSYIADLYTPSGALKWSLPIPADAAKNTINIQAPGLDTSGDYLLVLRGASTDGKTTEVRRYTLRSVGK
jgi:hypothetical protein